MLYKSLVQGLIFHPTLETEDRYNAIVKEFILLKKKKQEKDIFIENNGKLIGQPIPNSKTIIINTNTN